MLISPSGRAISKPEIENRNRSKVSVDNRRHRCLQKNACATFFLNPMQHGPFPERLRLPYPDEEILSGYEKDVFLHSRPFCYVGESISWRQFIKN